METITDHELNEIANDWAKEIPYENIGIRSAFAAGYRFVEQRANELQSENCKLSIPHISNNYCGEHGDNNIKLPLQNVKPRFPKEQLHLEKGSRILNIRGRHIVNKPEILINCMEYWEPTDEDYGSAEEDSATYFPTVTEIDEIIKALNEAKAFLNEA